MTMEEKGILGPVKILPQIQDWVVSKQLVVGWRENEGNDG